MGKLIISKDKIVSIANAIRAKTKKSDSLTLDQMVTEINSIGTTVGKVMSVSTEFALYFDNVRGGITT